MKFTLEINMDNDATQSDAELAGMLRKAATEVDVLGTELNRRYVIKDINGNTVGSYGVHSTPECPDCSAPSDTPLCNKCGFCTGCGREVKEDARHEDPEL